MEFQEIVDFLAKTAGLENGFAANEDGSVTVGAPGVFVTLKELPANGALMMRAELGALPEKGSDRLVAALLEGNFMGRGAAGGVFSLSGARVAFVHRLLPLVTADGKGFLREFRGFVEVAREWKRLVDDAHSKFNED